MREESKKFLYKLLTTSSPTGFEQPVQRVVRTRMKPYADTITTSLNGNVIVGVNTKAKRRVMISGHADQIGFMVRHVSDEGYIYVVALGGIDTGVLFGAHVTIHSKSGPIHGIFGRKPIHNQKPDERSKAKADLDQAWIDIGSKNKKDVEKKIAIGDPVTFRLGVTELTNDLISSPGLDDKAGLFVAMETLRLCARAKLKVGLFAVSTVQEEIGTRGAITSSYGVDPEIGIAVDVTPATDNPGHSDKKDAPCKLGGGPTITRGPNTNPVLEKRLVAAAKKARISYQPAIDPRPHSTDARAMQVTKEGVAATTIGLPNRYMHTQGEVCSLKDLEQSAKLLAQFVKDISAATDFRPK